MAKNIISKIENLRRPENTVKIDSILEHLNLIFDSFFSVYDRNQSELHRAHMFLDWSVENNKPVSEHPEWTQEKHDET